MAWHGLLRMLTVASAVIGVGACAGGMAKPDVALAPAMSRLESSQAPKRAALPETFESEDFIVTVAREGDSVEALAARFLGDPTKAWLIEDYNGTRRLPQGQEVVIPRRAWNPAGVESTGYQLVPVLVYHNIGPQAKGRLLLAVSSFEEQMRYLKAYGYRVVSLKEFCEFNALGRQLPRKSVVLTFDDGHRSFLQYAYPILKGLGFTATLFVHTDYVEVGRNALNWNDLRMLAREGFQIEAHSKTHGDLRRRASESDEDYAGRMRAELSHPQVLFQRHLGRSSRILAYPYGKTNAGLIEKLKEYGYVAGFTALRQGNPSFAHPMALHRSQIYAGMSLKEFARTLDTFHQEAIE